MIKGFFDTQLKAGLKFTVEKTLFDLCGQKPRNNMDIYITEEGRLSCGKPKYYIGHFIGNVKLSSSNPYGCGYSVYVVSVKRDVNPSKASVELEDNTNKHEKHIIGEQNESTEISSRLPK